MIAIVYKDYLEDAIVVNTFSKILLATHPHSKNLQIYGIKKENHKTLIYSSENSEHVTEIFNAIILYIEKKNPVFDLRERTK